MNHTYPHIPQAIYAQHIANANHHAHQPSYPLTSAQSTNESSTHNNRSYPQNNGGEYQNNYAATPPRPLIVSSTPNPTPPVMAPPFIPHFAHNMPPAMPAMPYRNIQMHTPPPHHNMHHHHQHHHHMSSSGVPPPFYRSHSHSYSQPLTPPPVYPEHYSYIPSPSTSHENTVTKDPSSPLSTSASAPRYPHFRPPLPWYSAPDEPFPPRARKSKKNVSTRTKRSEINDSGLMKEEKKVPKEIAHSLDTTASKQTTSSEDTDPLKVLTASPSPKPNASTPVVPKAPSAPATSTSPTTPASSVGTGPSSARPQVAVPYIPHLPHSNKSPQKQNNIGKGDEKETTGDNVTESIDDVIKTSLEDAKPPSPPAPPKSWADLVRSKTSKVTGTEVSSKINVVPQNLSGTSTPKAGTLSEIIRAFEVGNPKEASIIWKMPLLQPRGLINTGNMCFMNAVFQMLVFCPPFYMFLDRIGKNVVHNFRSETPLMDAMILFMQEFKSLDGQENTEAISGSVARKNASTALAGDPFVPEYVYEALKGIKRFASMRRGHQQDAEEFLGFLLDALHEESILAIKNTLADGDRILAANFSETASTVSDDSSGWLEVGHKQKTAITRTVGHVTGISPVTKIFGGSLRSELRISGQKNSVTREPYQPLQLDIHEPHINNILDALRNMTTPETLSGGEFKSARGTNASVTKQVFIETLPPILILHLKRFQYDNTGGTQKIWKKIGYPVDLEIPKEVLSPARRNPQPEKYKLIGVIYHHGKSASGGHYTVDVRRQDGWIRMDDTIVKRVAEKEVTVEMATSVKIIKDKKEDQQQPPEEGEWQEVNGSTNKPLSNGYINQGSNNDKVAYILFYSQSS